MKDDDNGEFEIRRSYNDGGTKVGAKNNDVNSSFSSSVILAPSNLKLSNNNSNKKHSENADTST